MSNETNKSAVEQLAIALYENGFLQGDGDRIQEIVEIFKEMEKEQTLKFGIQCQLDFIKSDGIRTVDDIYEQTYGGNK